MPCSVPVLGQFAHQHDFALVFQKKLSTLAAAAAASCSTCWGWLPCRAVAEADGQSPRDRCSSARGSDGHTWAAPCAQGTAWVFGWAAPCCCRRAQSGVPGRRFNSSLAPAKSSTTRGPTTFRGCIFSFSFWLADCHG